MPPGDENYLVAHHFIGEPKFFLLCLYSSVFLIVIQQATKFSFRLKIFWIYLSGIQDL